MQLEVLCVCRRPPGWVSEAVAQYTRRLPRTLSLDFVFLAPGPDSASAAVRRNDEGTRLLGRLKHGVPLVALDVGGKTQSSEAFAAALGRLRDEHRRLALAVGGADGLADAVLERATARWSLSALTLPHLLVQVVVAEQVYRAWTILEGHPYHRA
ncbi:MAG: 23S rRNA (pseudouridine(1915)-N(3))-methyltransferase RlmH [Gammaproteobacteria bacterium]